MKLPTSKMCGCGVRHDEVPSHAIFDKKYEVYYWECLCFSTLMYTPDREKTFAIIASEAKFKQQDCPEKYK